MRRTCALLLLICLSVLAQDATKPGRPWSFGMIALPSSPALVPVDGNTTRTLVSVDYLYLANTSASAVSVTVVDQSTSCNGGACQIGPTVAMAANSIYSIPVLGAPMRGGILWSAGTANVIHAYIAGRY